MTEYDKLLIELLKEKVYTWERRFDDMRKENDRLKRQIKKLEKERIL